MGSRRQAHLTLPPERDVPLLPYLEPRWRAEIAHAVQHLGMVSAYRRLTGGRFPSADAHAAQAGRHGR